MFCGCSGNGGQSPPGGPAPVTKTLRSPEGAQAHLAAARERTPRSRRTKTRCALAVGAVLPTPRGVHASIFSGWSAVLCLFLPLAGESGKPSTWAFASLLGTEINVFACSSELWGSGG